MHTPTQSIVFVLSLSLTLDSFQVSWRASPERSSALATDPALTTEHRSHSLLSLSLSLCHNAAARQPSGLCWGEGQCATRPIPERAPRWQPRHPFVPDRPRCQTARPPRASPCRLVSSPPSRRSVRSRFDVFIDVCIPSMPSHFLQLGSPLTSGWHTEKKKKRWASV